ncbi:MAG TPA: dihydrolipoyllysine-residue acetyltransferase [Gammaproteobacteria bacterium]
MEISVPDLGDAGDVEITDILVKVGDRIEPEDPLVSLETEKATVDVPSPAAGAVVEIRVSVGDRVSTGDVLMVVDGDTVREGADAGTQEPAPKTGGPSPSAAKSGASDDPPAAAARPKGGGGNGAAGREPSGAKDAAAAAGEVRPRSVTVPDLGDFADVEVIEVLVREGDEVEAEQGLITLETEKASMDVPAPEPGVVLSLSVAVGDRVSAGDEILKLQPRLASAPQPEPPKSAPTAIATRSADAAAVPSEAPAAVGPRRAPEAAPAAQPPVPAPIDERSFSRAHASPSVRKLARELGVDLGRVRGTGPKGRIRADDVKSFVKEALRGGAGGGALPALPEIDFAKFGEIEHQPLSRIQRISAQRLHASWVNLPHVTQHDEADITELEETRQSLKEQAAERGIRLTPLAFILRACVLTLAEFPRFKSSLAKDGQTLIVKRYTHLGFAVDTKNGLVVPVIRDADRKDVYELAAELGALSERARAGKLGPDDMQGGVFTVSSLGGIGGTFFTPIINAPEVAILGVSRNQWRPVWQDGQFVPRLMLPLSLSYDHRVIDGAEAVRFTTRLAETLGQVDRLLEAIP